MAGRLASLVILALASSAWAQEGPARGLKVGYAQVDITPPVGTILPGFHEPGRERVVKEVRAAPSATCVTLQHGDFSAAIVTLDVLAVGRDWCDRVRASAAQTIGIPAANVHLVATHTHAMPSLRPIGLFCPLSEKYAAQVEKAVVRGIQAAQKDQAAVRKVHVGTALVPGASYNRTAKIWKHESDFTKNSDDSERWLDRTLSVVRLDRGDECKPVLVWHFSAHAVVDRDDSGVGPDYPGLVGRQVLAKLDALPIFLQGHCGDVNPGDGKTQLGDRDDVARRLLEGIEQALQSPTQLELPRATAASEALALPLDLDRHKAWMAAYEEAQASGKRLGKGWISPSFARHWYEDAKARPAADTLPAPLGGLALGNDLALVFHPGELYSGYGLAIRRDSPFRHTLAVGYSNDLVGYVTDAKAHADQEYAANVVPKMLGLPPFRPTAGRELTAGAVRLLQRLHADISREKRN